MFPCCSESAVTNLQGAPNVVADYRRFAEDELHQAQKSARERQLAELKKFKDTFKVRHVSRSSHQLMPGRTTSPKRHVTDLVQRR